MIALLSFLILSNYLKLAVFVYFSRRKPLKAKLGALAFLAILICIGGIYCSSSLRIPFELLMNPKAWPSGILVLIAYLVILGRIFRFGEKSDSLQPVHGYNEVGFTGRFSLAPMELLLFIVSIIFTSVICLMTRRIETLITFSFALEFAYIDMLAERLWELTANWIDWLKQRAFI